MDSPSNLPPPPRENLPTLLLLQPQYFEQLFLLMQTLSAMKTPVKGRHQLPHTKAQVLSRRVWDILTLLPTSPKLLQGFQELEKSNDTSLEELLDPTSPQKLMYSLYIVESLCRPAVNKKHKVVQSTDSDSKEKLKLWSELFVQNGGLRHLFDIFMSGSLQRGDGSEWQQDCLATLLKLLCQLGMLHSDGGKCEQSQQESPAVSVASADTVPRSKQRRKKTSNLEKPVPKLNDAMLQMLNVDGVMSRLTSILYEASLPRDPNHYKTGFWGRAQVGGTHRHLPVVLPGLHNVHDCITLSCCSTGRTLRHGSVSLVGSLW
jgi:ubiquitin carboxyl-terminal hydrolase 34